jgi:phosphoribosylformylglycinamidine cyclo-ligase
VLDLLAAGFPVHGLAHITGGGVLNLLRLGDGIGYAIEAPLPVTPVFGLVARLGEVSAAEMWEVFNMGCGFCAIVAAEHAEEAVAIVSERHPGSAVIGRLTDEPGRISIPPLGLGGDSTGLRATA